MTEDLRHFRDYVNGMIDLNMLEEASEECLRMVEQHPDDAKFLSWCGGAVSLGTKEQISRLRVYFDRYLEKEPTDWGVRQVGAILLDLEGRHQESMAEFTQIPDKELRHDVRWFWFNKLLNEGTTDAVRRWIREVWSKYSTIVRKEHFSAYLKFLWDVSAFQAKDGEYEIATFGYEFLLKHDPGAVGAYLDYGRLLLKLGRRDDAIDIFKKGLGLSLKQIDNQNTSPGAINYCAEERDQAWVEIRKELASVA